MDFDQLVELAKKAMQNAYAPYSHFRVGAAVLMESGKVYTGANVENSSFGATICAERTAITKAISEGEKKIVAVAIASDLKDTIYPCGICRQVIAEFATPNTVVICSDGDGKKMIKKCEEILPHSFHF